MKHLKKFAAGTLGALMSVFACVSGFGLTSLAAETPKPAPLPHGYTAEKIGNIGDNLNLRRANGFLYLGQNVKGDLITTACGEKFRPVSDDSNAVITYDGKKTFCNDFGILAVYDNAGITRAVSSAGLPLSADEYNRAFFGGQFQRIVPFIKVIVKDTKNFSTINKEALLGSNAKLFKTADAVGADKFEYISVAQKDINGDDFVVVTKDNNLLSLYDDNKGTLIGSLKLTDTLAKLTPVVQYLPNGKILLTFMKNGSSDREGAFIADGDLKNVKTLFDGEFDTPKIDTDAKLITFSLKSGGELYYTIESSKDGGVKPTDESQIDKIKSSVSEFAPVGGSIKVTFDKTNMNTTATVYGPGGFVSATLKSYSRDDKLLTASTDNLYIIGCQAGMIAVDKNDGLVVSKLRNIVTEINILSKSQDTFSLKVRDEKEIEYYKLYCKGLTTDIAYESVSAIPSEIEKDKYIDGYYLGKLKSNGDDVLIRTDGKIITDYTRTDMPSDGYERKEIKYDINGIISAYSYLETRSSPSSSKRERTEFFTIDNTVVLKFNDRKPYTILNLKDSNALLIYDKDIYYVRH